MKTKINNRLLHFVFTLLLILSVTSCNDALDVMPKDRKIPENYFRNENELQMFSNKFYTQLPDEAAIIREGVDHIAKSDMSNELRGNRIIPGSGSGWTWTQLRDINTLLENSDNCPDRDIKTEPLWIENP